MSVALTDTLYVALACYCAGTAIAFSLLFTRARVVQTAALSLMIAGFLAHTVYIGTICAKTGHPPLTNLPEASAFISWTILAIALVLYFRYRVSAASFFVYPLVLFLLLVTAVVGEPFTIIDPALRSWLLTTHVLMTALGVAWLLVGLAFTTLAYLQDQSLRSKSRGRLWDRIPSLSICKRLGNGALSIGFVGYTIGLMTGVLWSWRTVGTTPSDLNAKQVGATVAWILFGLLLQARMAGMFRARRWMFVSAGAFVAIVVSIMGIARG